MFISTDDPIVLAADVNVRFTAPHTETPLHWAATTLWEASALGLLDRVEAYFSADPKVGQ